MLVATDPLAHITAHGGSMSNAPSPHAIVTTPMTHENASGRGRMKRFLLGLSIASGVAMAGVFALTQAKRGGALAADASGAGSSQGQSSASSDPWVQPMPKTMTGGVGDSLARDPFAAAAPLGQRPTNAGQTTGALQNQGSTGTGVQIRTVSARQTPDRQGSSSGGTAGAAADPFAGLPPAGDTKNASPSATAVPRSGANGNDTRGADPRSAQPRTSGG